LETLQSLAGLLRVRQWVKNGFVFAPLFFGFKMDNIAAFDRVALAFVVFCLASSAVYIFNDWRDLAADRQHPKKSMRPLAAGRISVRAALVWMTALLAAAAAIIVLADLPAEFSAAVGLYLAMNLGYSLGFKHVAVVELFFVATGFLLRLMGGAYAARVEMSPWILVATGMLALLIAIGKRRGDIAQADDADHRRKSLDGYNLAFLDASLAALTGGTIVVYMLFCASDYAIQRFSVGVLITAVPVTLGLLRYLQLVMVYGRGESPTDLLLTDRALLAILVAFGAIFGYLIYA